MAELGRRETVVDPLALNPLQKGPDRSLPTYGVRNPGQSAGNAATKMGMSALQALDGIQATINRAYDEKKAEWEVDGQIAHARGKTEASLGDNKYSRRGWQSMEATSKASSWFANQVEFINSGDGASMNPEEYEQYLKQQQAEQLANLPEDPAARKMWMESYKDYGPRLMSMQTTKASEYNEARGVSSLTNSILGIQPSGTDTSVGTPDRGYRVSMQPVRQPLQNVSVMDDDLAIRTILGEAAGEGSTGMAAVASVIMNRTGSGRFPNTVGEVVQQHKQFSTWNTGEGGNNPNKWDPNSAAYKKAAAIWNDVKSGRVVDQTGGATHYTRKDIKAYWWDEESSGKDIEIGNHKFAGFTKPEGGLIEQAASNAGEGALSFNHAGQESGLQPAFKTALLNTSSYLGKQLKITSGHRDAEYNASVGGAKDSRHVHGDAADIDMTGMSDEERYNLVQTLRANGMKRFISYSKSPNMLHVDMSDAQGQSWFMHDKSNDTMHRAPTWLQRASQEEAPVPQQVDQARVTGSQLQRYIQNSPLSATAKAKAVTDAMVRAFDSGDDGVFNDAGGISVLIGLGATNEQLKKVYDAQSRWESKKDKEFDLDREKARADLLARVSNGEFASQADALNAVDEFYKTNGGTSSQATALAREVANEWEKKSGDGVVPIPMRTQAARLKENLDLGLITPEEAAQGIEDMGRKLGVKASVINNFMTDMYNRDQSNRDRLRNEAVEGQKKAAAQADTMTRITTALANGYGLKGMTGSVNMEDPRNPGIIRTMSAEQAGIELLKKNTLDSVNEAAAERIAKAGNDPRAREQILGQAQVEATKAVYENLAKQGVYDTAFGAEIAASVTGDLIDPETKRVSEDAVRALDVYMQLRNNPKVGDEYVAGMIQNPQARIFLETAQGLYNGQYNMEAALRAAQTTLSQKLTPEEHLDKTAEYSRRARQSVAQTTRELIGRDGWFQRLMDSSGSGTNAQVDNSPAVDNYLYNQADTYFRMNRNISTERAVELATQDLKRNAVVVGKNVLIGNEQAGTRLDQLMGLTVGNAPRNVEIANDAVNRYLQDFAGHPDNWGQLWNNAIKPGVGGRILRVAPMPEYGVTVNPVSGFMEVVLYKDASRTDTVGEPLSLDIKSVGDYYKKVSKAGEGTWFQKGWRDYIVDPIATQQQTRNDYINNNPEQFTNDLKGAFGMK